MRKKIIFKLIISGIIILMGILQLVVCVSFFLSFTGGGALAGLSSIIPQMASVPLLVVGVIDTVCLCKAYKSEEKTNHYRNSYNVLLGVLICIFLFVFGIVCLINGALGFFIGAMAEGYGDTVYLVGLGSVYALFVPVICAVLFVSEIIATVLIAKADR